MPKKFLDKVYDLKTADETRALYDAWAASYDAEVAENGYATPRRVAEALHAVSSDPAAPILDFGCGTGLSGMALRLAGFQTIDGADLSSEMLEGARAKGVYRSLCQVEAGAAMPGAPGDYTAIAAIGVIGVGAAPIDTFDTIMDALDPGGRFAFSFNDHALADPAFEAKVADYLTTGRAAQLYHDYGDHLPKLGLKSAVYVLEKT